MTADDVEEAAQALHHLAKILRGEEQDLTGFGYWMILCDHLERVLNVKIITVEQYQAFVELENSRQ